LFIERRLGVVLPSTSRSHRDYIKEKAQRHDPRQARQKNDTPWGPTRMPTPYGQTKKRKLQIAQTEKRRVTPRSSPRQAADRSKESAAILCASIRTFSTTRRLGAALSAFPVRTAAMVRREMPPALDDHAVASGANAIGRWSFRPSVAAAGNAVGARAHSSAIANMFVQVAKTCEPCLSCSAGVRMEGMNPLALAVGYSSSSERLAC